MKKQILLAALALAGLTAQAQVDVMPTNVNKVRVTPLRSSDRNLLIFPNLPGYVTLKGDFHMHTVGSDGSVKGNISVLDAWRDGLDVIAITDHIGQSNSKYPQDRATSYNQAIREAEAKGILLVRAGEIAGNRYRWGHLNCLFLTDQNKLVKDSIQDALAEAKRQGAFIFLNHPGWSRDTCSLLPAQIPYVEDGTIQGVEVFNGGEHYPRAISWAVDKKWTIFGNSDNHSRVEAAQDGIFRNMTIVFAKDRSLEGVREALDHQRTLAYAGGILCGQADLLKQFFLGCVQFVPVGRTAKNKAYEVRNTSSITYWVSINRSRYRLDPFQSVLYSFQITTTTATVEVQNMRCYENQFLTFKYDVK